MTLYRQLIALLIVMYVLVFVGTFTITVDNTRQYLVEQLESHAQDTATSLGLSLSSPSVAGDVLMMKSMIDAVFDRGEYREILIETIDGKSLIDRALVVKVYDVPDWFVRWMPLDTPEATAKVMTGWRQLGHVRVKSHPGHAYHQLWKNALETFRWSLLTFFVAILVSGIALHFVLRSLRAVEAQALAIADREFPRIEQIPRTRELRRVVLAMNRMSEKIEGMLEDLYKQMEQLRESAYGDTVTGLGNESAFSRDLERFVTTRDEHSYGIVAILRMRGLDEANRVAGYALGDTLLKATAERLRETAEKHHGAVARIGGALFGLILPDVPRSEIRNVIDPLVSDLSRLTVGELTAAGLDLGIAYYGGGQSAKQLRERAELARQNAESQGINTWHVYDATETAAGRDLSHEQRWRGVLETVIERGAVDLAAQPVKSADMDVVLQQEILARIRPHVGGELVTPGIFFPMAARVGLADAMDKAIIKVAADTVKRLSSDPSVFALNLSRFSVESVEFADWLLEFLKSEERLAERLSFEIAEGIVAANPNNVMNLASKIKSSGAGFGVDHCGARDMALDYLKRLKADYIKLDGSLITGLERDADRQAYLRSLLAVARGLNIRTYALHVESEGTLDVARTLGFDGYQGNLIGRPEPF